MDIFSWSVHEQGMEECKLQVSVVQVNFKAQGIKTGVCACVCFEGKDACEEEDATAMASLIHESSQMKGIGILDKEWYLYRLKQ